MESILNNTANVCCKKRSESGGTDSTRMSGNRTVASLRYSTSVSNSGRCALALVGAKLSRSLATGLRERSLHFGRDEVRPVDRRSRLLAPGLSKAARIHRIEPDFIDKTGNDGFGLGVVSSNRNRNAPRGSGWQAE